MHKTRSLTVAARYRTRSLTVGGRYKTRSLTVGGRYKTRSLTVGAGFGACVGGRADAPIGVCLWQGCVITIEEHGG